MKITVTATVSDYVFELDVSGELELENFKAFCEVESGFPSNEIVISFKGQPLLDDKKSLIDYGIGDGDMVELQHIMQAATAAAAANVGGQQASNGRLNDGSGRSTVRFHQRCESLNGLTSNFARFCNVSLLLFL